MTAIYGDVGASYNGANFTDISWVSQVTNSENICIMYSIAGIDCYSTHPGKNGPQGSIW